MNEGTMTIALDIELNQTLIEEGIARELINRIQNLRKSSGLEVTDRIVIIIENKQPAATAVENFREYICSQVLATSLTLADNVEGETFDLQNYTINVKITKA